jgi:predicted phosphodiesterase
MKLIDKTIHCKSRSDVFYFYVLGDIHLGTLNCAESQLRRLVQKMAHSPNSLWWGGGDYCECIKPSDMNRYEAEGLPDWILGPDADSVRDNLRDVVAVQKRQFKRIVDPIKGKCLGLIEGNHEATMRKYHNLDHHGFVCSDLEVEDLTSEAFFRLKFKLGKITRLVKVFICHGHGGGRTPAAEPNHLFKLAAHWSADIILRGHSHIFCILSPMVELGLPDRGALPDECLQYYKRAGNWGCWVKSYAAGPSTYVTRRTYPPRPLSTLEIEIRPHIHSHKSGPEQPKISMKELVV